MSRIGVDGRGESTWLAWFLCATMDRFDDLLIRAGHTVEKADWRARADALRKIVDDAAWDGHWYVRAFHEDG